MGNIQFNPRWKEELVASSNEGTLIFEFTMGVSHVYFPTEELWMKEVPDWAKHRWNEFKTACERWCEENRIPMSVVENTYVGSWK